LKGFLNDFAELLEAAPDFLAPLNQLFVLLFILAEEDLVFLLLVLKVMTKSQAYFE